MIYIAKIMLVICLFLLNIQYKMLYKSIYPHPESPLLLKQSKKVHQEQLPIHFPQDYQVIVRSDRLGYGNLYIGNLEAALNSTLLKSMLILIQICKLLLFFLLPKATNLHIPNKLFDIINIFPFKISLMQIYIKIFMKVCNFFLKKCSFQM